MAIQFLLISLAVVLFGGLFVALALAYREIEADRAEVSSKPAEQAAPEPTLYRWRVSDAKVAEELMLRQIEHHLRREAMLAEQFVNNPNPHTLRAGDDVRLGSC